MDSRVLNYLRFDLTRNDKLWHAVNNFTFFRLSTQSLVLGGIIKMMRKILTLGLILFLSSACLPQISLHPKKTLSYLSQPNAEEFSLFTPSELQELFSVEGNSLRAERRTLLAALVTDGQPVWNPDPSISDEANDDFIPIVSLEDTPEERKRFRYSHRHQCPS